MKFFSYAALDQSNPFPEGSEVLLSVSIIFKDGKFAPEVQTGEGFMEMVNAIIGNPHVTKVTLLNTARLQIHREILNCLAAGMDLQGAEIEAEKLVAQYEREWEEQNQSAISALRTKYGANFSILHWGDLRPNDPNGQLAMRVKVFNARYNQSPLLPQLSSSLSTIKHFNDLKKALKNLVNIFVNGLTGLVGDKIRSGKFSRKEAWQYMYKIAVEECVARTLLRFPYEIYRGALNIPAIMLYKAWGEQDKMQFITIGDEEEIQHARELALRRSPQGNQCASSSASSSIIQTGFFSASSSQIAQSPPIPIPLPRSSSTRDDTSDGEKSPRGPKSASAPGSLQPVVARLRFAGVQGELTIYDSGTAVEIARYMAEISRKQNKREESLFDEEASEAASRYVPFGK